MTRPPLPPIGYVPPPPEQLTQAEQSELFDQDRTDLYRRLGSLHERNPNVPWPFVWKAGVKLRDEGSLITDAAVLNLARHYERHNAAYQRWAADRRRRRWKGASNEAEDQRDR